MPGVRLNECADGHGQASDAGLQRVERCPDVFVIVVFHGRPGCIGRPARKSTACCESKLLALCGCAACKTSVPGAPSAVPAGVPSKSSGKCIPLDTPGIPRVARIKTRAVLISRGAAAPLPPSPSFRPISRARSLRALFCPACCRYSACRHGLLLRTPCRCACETARRHARAVVSLGTCLRRPRAEEDGHGGGRRSRYRYCRTALVLDIMELHQRRCRNG
jgi:hypothetical protein